ncbi:MAG: oligosaccharide flippase family protein [Calditrichia bacterium]
MKETRKFIKESTIYGIGEILTKSLAFLLIPVFIRYLSKSEFGVYNLVITIWPILIIIFGKGFSSYIIRGYYQFQKEEERKSFAGNILLFSLVASVLLALLVHLFGDLIFNPLFKEVRYKPFLQFAVFIAVLKLFINNVMALYKAKRQPTKVVAIALLNFLSTVGLILFLVIILKKGLMGALLGQVLGLALLVLLLLVYVQKDIRLSWNFKQISAAILFVLPLIPHGLSAWVINLSDRVLIERFATLEDVAIYSLGYQLAMALDILINSMNQAWMPFFYSLADKPEGRKEIKSSITYYFVAVVAIGLLLALFSKELIFLLGKNEYLEADRIFPLIILAFVIHSVYYIASSSLFYRSKTSVIPLITISGGTVNIGLNILLIPQYGYIAAAYSTIASFLIVAVIAYLLSKKYYPQPFQFGKMSAVFLIALGIFIGGRFFFPDLTIIHLAFKTVLAGLFPICLIILGIIKPREIKALLPKLKR